MRELWRSACELWADSPIHFFLFVVVGGIIVAVLVVAITK